MSCDHVLKPLCLVLLMAPVALGDTVVVGDAEFHGRVEEKGDKILLHTAGGGYMTFPRSAVSKIIRSEETVPPPADAEEPGDEDPADDSEGDEPDDILMSGLPEMPVPFGGTATFADEAFPIKARRSRYRLQRALRSCKALPCRACRASGEDFRKVTFYPRIPGVFMRKPNVITWKEPCPQCGGYGDVYDEKFGDRCIALVDALTHAKRDDEFASLRSLAAERLRATFETRSKSWKTYHCVDVRRRIKVTTVGTDGLRRTHYEYVTVKEKREAGTKEFTQVVADRVSPLWPRAGFQKPAGQAVAILGNIIGRTTGGGWTWARIQPEHPSTGGRGPDALLLCGGTLSRNVPTGRAVVGGLLLGRCQGGPSGSLPIVLVAVASAP
jgi:hypothetical protein